MAGGSGVGVGRLTRLVAIAVLASACAGAPDGSGGSGQGEPNGPSKPGAPGQIASIEGANVLIRGERGTPNASAEDVAAIAQADTAFALELFRELARDGDENLVVGPYSVWTALSMVYAGARGETAEELEDVLHFDRPLGETTELLNALEQALESRNDPDAVELNVANQLFAQPGFQLLDEYLVTLTRDFGAPLAELSFADPDGARGVINKWAADRTNGRIEELFPPGTISPQTALVLCNAISLDAAWTYLFDPTFTNVQPFQTPTGEVSVPMMHFDYSLPLYREPGLEAVELPYGKGDLSMVVLLPEDLDVFVRDVSAERLDRTFRAISDGGIHLHLPKFSFSAHVALDETLQRMGIRSAYSADADLSGMTGSPGLYLDTVQHEAFIEVDEAGTEAHAASGAGIPVSHGPTIMLDRPFAFVIRDRPTGTILFMGIVADPLQS